MSDRKTTKRALLGSVISLLLCFAMLLGTTFAWFTDNAATGSNVITSGNLDVEVEYTLDGINWDKLDGADDLFNKSLWEPGHTEVVALRIKNNGSLALKYNVNMNIVGETIGKTKDNKDIVLSDILTVSTLNHEVNQMGELTLGLAFEGEDKVDYENTTTFKDGSVLDNDKELQPGVSHYLIVKVDMAETVGNEANHNGIDIPKITFGINVNATQFTSEEDSFGNQYDKDATYDTEIPLAITKSFSATDVVKLKKSDGTEVTILGDNLTIDTDGSISSFGVKLGVLQLDAAYQFQPKMTAEEVKSSEYANWHADFVVHANKDVPADSIVLAGYYDAWCSINNDKWVALPNVDMPVSANNEVRLVKSMGDIYVSYEEICTYGNDGIGFLCGAKAYGTNKLKSGTRLTVELRLYKTYTEEECLEKFGYKSANVETGEYITVGEYYYTFK